MRPVGDSALRTCGAHQEVKDILLAAGAERKNVRATLAVSAGRYRYDREHARKILSAGWPNDRQHRPGRDWAAHEIPTPKLGTRSQTGCQAPIAIATSAK